MAREKLLPESGQTKADAIVMPKPKVLDDSRVQIGRYTFKPTHPLTKIGFGSRK